MVIFHSSEFANIASWQEREIVTETEIIQDEFREMEIEEKMRTEERKERGDKRYRGEKVREISPKVNLGKLSIFLHILYNNEYKESEVI